MHRRTLLKAGLVAPAAPLVTGALTASPAAAAPRVTGTLATGLSFPWGMDFLPDGRGLVTERNSGRILLVRPDGGYRVAGVVPGVFNNGGEGGLMGLALSPDFATDRFVYAFLTTRSDNRVVKMRYRNGSLGGPRVVLAGIPRATTHNGGGLWFTDYPSLYVTCGDTRRPALAQDKRSRGGKILRLKPDGTAQRGNPFGSRVYSYGHRNPQGIAKDSAGNLWSTELGENTWDELNRIIPGRNYGWPRQEGKDGRGGYTDPVAQWSPADCSPSGLALAGGRAWIGALRGQALWSVDIAGVGRSTKRRYLHRAHGRIRMVKRAPDGALWIGTSNGGGADKILRVTL